MSIYSERRKGSRVGNTGFAILDLTVWLIGIHSVLHIVAHFHPITLTTEQNKIQINSQRSAAAYLERRKPVRPEWDASSMSGVTIRSIMSDSTVKVGTTMKSIKPGDRVRERKFTIQPGVFKTVNPCWYRKDTISAGCHFLNL